MLEILKFKPGDNERKKLLLNQKEDDKEIDEGGNARQVAETA